MAMILITDNPQGGACRCEGQELDLASLNPEQVEALKQSLGISETAGSGQELDLANLSPEQVEALKTSIGLPEASTYLTGVEALGQRLLKCILEVNMLSGDFFVGKYVYDDTQASRYEQERYLFNEGYISSGYRFGDMFAKLAANMHEIDERTREIYTLQNNLSQMQSAFEELKAELAELKRKCSGGLTAVAYPNPDYNDSPVDEVIVKPAVPVKEVSETITVINPDEQFFSMRSESEEKVAEAPAEVIEADN